MNQEQPLTPEELAEEAQHAPVAEHVADAGKMIQETAQAPAAECTFCGCAEAGGHHSAECVDTDRGTKPNPFAQAPARDTRTPGQVLRDAWNMEFGVSGVGPWKNASPAIRGGHERIAAAMIAHHDAQKATREPDFWIVEWSPGMLDACDSREQAEAVHGNGTGEVIPVWASAPTWTERAQADALAAALDRLAILEMREAEREGLVEEVVRLRSALDTISAETQEVWARDVAQQALAGKGGA